MSKSNNTNMYKAKKEKNDEFYTQLSDIEKELKHYRPHFKDKIVYCNCDDPTASKFFHYFAHNFEKLQLKKLIATCYKSQTRDLFNQHNIEKAIYVEYEGTPDANIPNPNNYITKYLEGNGDFRSPECIELLKQSDIVVTNPPFSLFREYIAQLNKYNKNFLIIGNMNAITYKETFELIKDNKLWLGHNSVKEFKQPDGKIKKFGNTCWFTNLETPKHHEDLILYKKYNPKDYPKYDNYDAIEVNKTKEIPIDYNGVMGVPISFIDKYNPDQFEIVGKTNNKEHAGKYLTERDSTAMVKGKKLYHRILIKNKRLQNENQTKINNITEE